MLTRKAGETIYVGDDIDIEITVMGTEGYHVKLGIEAPKDVPVH